MRKVIVLIEMPPKLHIKKKSVLQRFSAWKQKRREKTAIKKRAKRINSLKAKILSTEMDIQINRNWKKNQGGSTATGNLGGENVNSHLEEQALNSEIESRRQIANGLEKKVIGMKKELGQLTMQ